ncbi:MAG: hypothetical protein IKE52_02705 [Mogibacterium sp.]|nr:hypothetical protein [Mogibacterium sp.]
MKNSTRKLINIIMAFVVSLGAWIFVVYNYYPMTDVKYGDVSLTFSGERALAERGLAVSEAGAEGISVTLNQKRVDVGRITEADIRAELDVSGCVAGENKITPNVFAPKEASVESYDNKAVDIIVERTDSKYLDVEVVYSEDAPEDAAPLVSDIGQTQARVVCAASKLKSVRKIAAVLDYDEVGEKTKSYTARLVALDNNGDEVPHAVIYPDEISLDASRGVIKTVDLVPNIRNEKSEDYERKYSAPDKITIKGSKEIVSKIDSIRTEEIDLSRYYENEELKLECILPEGVYLSNSADEDKLVLKLTVTKIEKEAVEEGSEGEAGTEEETAN